MSRSRKNHPGGFCSEKEYKQRAHRSLRRAVRIAIHKGDDPPPDIAFGDPWCGPKDGGWGWAKNPDPKWLRK